MSPFSQFVVEGRNFKIIPKEKQPFCGSQGFLVSWLKLEFGWLAKIVKLVAFKRIVVASVCAFLEGRPGFVMFSQFPVEFAEVPPGDRVALGAAWV